MFAHWLFVSAYADLPDDDRAAISRDEINALIGDIANILEAIHAHWERSGLSVQGFGIPDYGEVLRLNDEAELITYMQQKGFLPCGDA